MNLALAPYLFALYISISVCWFLAFYTWRRRHLQAAVPFAAAMFFAGLWAFFYGLELVAPSLESKLFWFNLKQLGILAVAPSVFLATLAFTRLRISYPRLLLVLLLIEPVVSLIIYWTNSWHGLAGTPRLVTDVLPFAVLYFAYGPWYWLRLFASYFLLLVATQILVVQIPGANKIYRRQLILILAGLLLPWLLGSLSILRVGNLEYLNVPTFFLPIASVFLGMGLFRYGLLQLTPVAYSAVFSSIRDGIIVLDQNFRIAELNPAALLMLGRKERALIGQSITDVFPIWDQSQLSQEFFEQNQSLEFYYEHGGQYRYLEVHSGVIMSSMLDAAGTVLILYDVTDRKLAEKARQVLEDRYRTIFETDSAATIILEEDMTISLANDEFARLAGYARQELEGKKKWTTFVHPEDVETMKQYHIKRRQNGEEVPDKYEFRFVDRNGRIKNVFVSVALVPNSRISIASMLDITDRKLAEQLLQQRATDLEAAVRSEQERSAIILRSVNDAIAVSDLSYKVAYVNPAFTRLSGYSQEEALGKPVSFILNGRIPQPIWRGLQGAVVDQTIWEGELQLKRKDGTVYEAAVLIAPMRDGRGQLIGYVSSHRDITQAKRLEESRRRFITNISHELRTPVTNIKLYTELLKRNFQTTRRDRYFATLNEQIERLESIIQNSLEIVYLEDEQKELHREVIHWEMLSESLQTRLQPQATEKKITLHFASQIAQLPPIIGDPQRISQAVYELIHNAISFTPAGGEVTIAGAVQQEQDGPYLTLSIKDNGPGIALAEQSRIFDRFYRGKQAESAQIPGTGLGLSMVTLIAQAHNGRLTVNSHPGEGSTFTLWFPLS
ncbi:MAG: PAS domain S-box protein [Anaerolineaceae bacterium]|nr:PAS domain S-box protein [Anaerolineaceae bacterium]